jgi:hypothetical protein
LSAAGWNANYAAAHAAWVAKARSMTDDALRGRHSLLSVRANWNPRDAGSAAAVVALLDEIERRGL